MNPMKILLGSASPRRAELLSLAGIPFERISIQAEEIYPHDLPKERIALYLAELKSQALQRALGEEELLITADSVVLAQDRVLGKPENPEQAREFLRLLSYQSHKVYTGVCLRSSLKTLSFTEETTVFFDKIEEEEIDYYLENFQPYDKAGSYGVQEWLGLCKIHHMEGTYTNVMGLPVHSVYKSLREDFPQWLNLSS
jgi:septum formation protein